MPFTDRRVWCTIVVVGLASLAGFADEKPKLPNRYAEVVLDVQGMT